MSELVRIEADGTRVVRKNNRIYRITPAQGPVGKYAPFHSRADMLRGRKDVRKTDWYAAAVRETRKNPMLQVTLKRGRKTKTVRVNPSPSRLKRAGYKRTLAAGSGTWIDGNRPWLEYARGGRAMKGEPSTVYRKRYFKTIAERDRALFDNPKRRNPETEQVELKLFIDNDGDLYRRLAALIQKNLTKKFVKGTYSHKLAVKAWKHLADEGAKKYAKEFSIGSDWNRMFSVADRNAVAKELADDWLAELKAGNRHNPKRRRNPRISKTTVEYVVQGNYGYGWEDENFETNKTDAQRSLREYRENGPGTYRLIRRRVKKEF